MNSLLQITTSLNGPDGLSSQLATEYTARWEARHPEGEVRVRDLAAEPVPHIDAATFAAFGLAPEARTPQQRAAVAISDALIAELKAADVIVLGLPMHNFSIPSVLKAYFDQVARAGVTFRYTEAGPEGLLKGKRAVLVQTRGGRYRDNGTDTQTPYVMGFLNFLGITEIDLVYAEGTAMGETHLNDAIADARRQIESLHAMAA